MIEIDPPDIPTAEDNLNTALFELEQAWEVASFKHETVLCSLINDAILSIKTAKNKIRKNENIRVN